MVNTDKHSLTMFSILMREHFRRPHYTGPTTGQHMSAQDIENPREAEAYDITTRHPVDLRLTLPLPGRPVFLSLVAGREKRSVNRRAVERKQHPLHTLGNAVFMIFSLVGFYLIALMTTLALGSVIKF